jgi:hypothetical protein
MMEKQTALKLGYKPMAKWLSGGDYGVDPKIMGISPSYAIPKALKKAGLKLSQMDVMECNEAFAVQNLAVIIELEKQTGEKVDIKKWNPAPAAEAAWVARQSSKICRCEATQTTKTGQIFFRQKELTSDDNTEAARLLGIHCRTLYRKLNYYRIALSD